MTSKIKALIKPYVVLSEFPDVAVAIERVAVKGDKTNVKGSTAMNIANI